MDHDSAKKLERDGTDRVLYPPFLQDEREGGGEKWTALAWKHKEQVATRSQQEMACWQVLGREQLHACYMPCDETGTKTST